MDKSTEFKNPGGGISSHFPNVDKKEKGLNM